MDAIGLYQFHRPDPKVPYAESVGVLKELLDAGKIRLAGISNANIEQIETARRILGDGNLASVQNQFSPAFRSSEPELRHCAEHGIAFLPWTPLGGIGRAASSARGTRRSSEIADAHGVSAQQVTLAWEVAKAPVVIPIPGASRPESILDSVAALGPEADHLGAGPARPCLTEPPPDLHDGPAGPELPSPGRPGPSQRSQAASGPVP